MNKLIKVDIQKAVLLFFMLFHVNIVTYSQCINNVSTNPESPRNDGFLPWANVQIPTQAPFTVNPFLNRLNWANPYSPIYIQEKAGFNMGGVTWINGQYPMLSPFNTGLSSSSAYNAAINTPNVPDRDYKWIDGWELLWINIGSTPDGVELFKITNTSPLPNPQSAAPVNIPYMVLYNRYRGIVRLFANVWFDSSKSRYQNVSAALTFVDEQEVNGMLRHTDSYDTPLDQKTSHQFIQGPNSHPLNADEWMLADFQVGFDPCICTRNAAKLEFRFKATDKVTLQMVSRSITVDKQLDNLDFLNEDFLNLDNIETGKDKPGSKIYKEMGAMVDAYKTALGTYETKLKDYQSADNVLKRSLLNAVKTGLGSVGGIVGSGVAGSIISNKPLVDFVMKMKPKLSIWSDSLINLDKNNAEDFANAVVGGTKSTIASGFDFLNAVMEVPGEPVRPLPPTASLTETNYVGSLSKIEITKSRALLVPGAIPNAYAGSKGTPGNPGLDRINYPAYNETLGLFALLKTPKVAIQKKRISVITRFPRASIGEVNTKPTVTNKYCIKLNEPLLYRFNHAVNLNPQKTKVYYSFRITFKRTAAVTMTVNNGNSLDLGPHITQQDVSIRKSSGTSEQLVEDGRLVAVVTTPFVQVTNALNEPQSITLDYLIDFRIIEKGVDFTDITKANMDNIAAIDMDNIEKIELKLMADMYFMDKGSLSQEMNSVQVFTYLVYKQSEKDNQEPLNDLKIGNIEFKGVKSNMIKHQEGMLTISSMHLSPSTISGFQFNQIGPGNELHVWTENVSINGDITVEPGYIALIHHLGSAFVLPESSLSAEVKLDRISGHELYGEPLIYEATDAAVQSFCSSAGGEYLSNQSLLKTAYFHQENPLLQRAHEFGIKFHVSPNPAAHSCSLDFTLKDDASVTIAIYDMSGRVVSSVISNTKYEKGKYSLPFSSNHMDDGIYFCTFTTSNGFIETQKLVIAK